MVYQMQFERLSIFDAHQKLIKNVSFEDGQGNMILTQDMVQHVVLWNEKKNST